MAGTFDFTTLKATVTNYLSGDATYATVLSNIDGLASGTTTETARFVYDDVGKVSTQAVSMFNKAGHRILYWDSFMGPNTGPMSFGSTSNIGRSSYARLAGEAGGSAFRAAWLSSFRYLAYRHGFRNLPSLY